MKYKMDNAEVNDLLYRLKRLLKDKIKVLLIWPFVFLLYSTNSPLRLKRLQIFSRLNGLDIFPHSNNFCYARNYTL